VFDFSKGLPETAMKKPANKKKKKRSSRKRSQSDSQARAAVTAEAPDVPEEEEKKPEKPPAPKKPVQPVVRKEPEKKKAEKKSVGNYISMAVQFLRDARIELKKVKWPTRKELLASTAMVIFLVLIAALFLGVIDFGLIKVIKTVVG
jgi:preprotein translocase subunit SecE